LRFPREAEWPEGALPPVFIFFKWRINNLFPINADADFTSAWRAYPFAAKLRA